MAPKIEVLDDIPISKPHQLKSSVGGTKKNPFATAKVKTERVDPKSIKDTSYRKGLNKPEFVRNSPLDLLFHELESKIMHFPLDELSLEKLYQQTNTHSNIDLIEVLTNYLIKIQDLSIAAKKRKQTDAETGSNEAHSSQDLISISLHDIRTFSRLVNLIIIHGVYPALESNKIGIPFAQRRLNDFSKLVTGNKKSISIDQIRDTEKKEKMLLLLFEKFFTVFSKNSSTGGDDVKDLLLRGTGYSDFLTITSALLTVHSISTESRDKVRLLYPQIISFPDTFELFQTFSLLMSSPSPNFFKQFVSLQIQTLHVMAPRGDGILTLIEFVLGLRENEEVNIEKFDHVANVILAKPKSINTVEYFTRVGNQIYTLLININKTVVNSCVCYVLEKLWLRNQLIVKDFVLKKLWKNFDPSVEAHDNNNKYSVSEADLNNNTNVIISLTKNNPSSSLLYAAFNCVLVYIWSYYLFLKKSNKSIGILKGFLSVTFLLENINNLKI